MEEENNVVSAQEEISNHTSAPDAGLENYFFVFDRDDTLIDENQNVLDPEVLDGVFEVIAQNNIPWAIISRGGTSYGDKELKLFRDRYPDINEENNNLPFHTAADGSYNIEINLQDNQDNNEALRKYFNNMIKYCSAKENDNKTIQNFREDYPKLNPQFNKPKEFLFTVGDSTTSNKTIYTINTEKFEANWFNSQQNSHGHKLFRLLEALNAKKFKLGEGGLEDWGVEKIECPEDYRLIAPQNVIFMDDEQRNINQFERTRMTTILADSEAAKITCKNTISNKASKRSWEKETEDNYLKEIDSKYKSVNTYIPKLLDKVLDAGKAYYKKQKNLSLRGGYTSKLIKELSSSHIIFPKINEYLNSFDDFENTKSGELKIVSEKLEKITEYDLKGDIKKQLITRMKTEICDNNKNKYSRFNFFSASYSGKQETFKNLANVFSLSDKNSTDNTNINQTIISNFIKFIKNYAIDLENLSPAIKANIEDNTGNNSKITISDIINIWLTSKSSYRHVLKGEANTVELSAQGLLSKKRNYFSSGNDSENTSSLLFANKLKEKYGNIAFDLTNEQQNAIKDALSQSPQDEKTNKALIASKGP